MAKVKSARCMVLKGGMMKCMGNVPYWPERLTRPDAKQFQPRMDLVETDIIRQVYITHNGVGPCVMIYDDGQFVAWFPNLTFDRTQSPHWGDPR